jgi:hypothetical protein
MQRVGPNNALHLTGRAVAAPRGCRFFRPAPSGELGRSCGKRSLAFLAGCKSLRSQVSPTTPPECCAGEGGANRTTRVKRPQGTTSTAGETARPDA